MLQVVSPDESAFPYRGDLEFEDLETGEKRLLEAGAIAADYRRAFAAFLDRSQQEAVRENVDYALMRTDAPPGRALRDFLMRREATSGTHTVGRRGGA
jgi:radical SAM superfamily enzyme with C-terminal helix-hairpin-helix motif